MDTYDLIMLGVLLGATLFGAWKGFAWQIAATASIVVSYFVAYEFRGALAPHMPVDAPLNIFVAMFVLYVGTSFAIWMGFRFVSQVIENVKLKEFDRQIGALLGLGSGIALCLVITFFSLTLLGEEKRHTICQSRSGLYIAKVIDQVHTMMPTEVHDVIGPYLHSLDNKLNHDHHDGDPPRGSGSFGGGGLDSSRFSPRRIPLNVEREGGERDSLERRGGGGGDLESRAGERRDVNRDTAGDTGFKIRFGDRDYQIRLRTDSGE